MGVAVGDFDNDGWPDLLITGCERVALYRNNHEGTFTDVTAKAGLAKLPSGWPTSAVWFDYDNDGKLDPILANAHPDDMIEMCSRQIPYKMHCFVPS